MRSRGLGDTIAKATKAVGIKPCGGCKKRQRRLNQWFPYKQGAMDIVIPLASGYHGRKKLGSKWENNELRYALRSLQQYFPNMGRVFIVTEVLPEWLTNVVHLFAKDEHRSNKDANLIDKVLLACKSGVSDTFIRMSDDQCLLSKWDGQGIWHRGDRDSFRDILQSNKWWKRFDKTCQHLEAHGRPCFFYDCHCPIQVDRKEFIRIAEEADYATLPGMCINTLYCNSVEIPREKLNGQKLDVHQRAGPNKLEMLTKDKLFLGYSHIGTNQWMKEFLQQRFPEHSRFEEDISSQSRDVLERMRRGPRTRGPRRRQAT